MKFLIEAWPVDLNGGGARVWLGGVFEMDPETGWEMARGARESRLGIAGMGALRVALLFGSAAVALTLLMVPVLEGQTRPRSTHAAISSDLDFISTGTTGRKGAYTIRRSVLQTSPEAVCIIREDGTRAGSC